MSWRIRTVLVCVVLLQIPVSAAPVRAQVPEDLGNSVDKLTTTVDRLANLLERELALNAETRETRQVEAAVAILGLRYRKIDRIESELRRIGGEEQEFPDHMAWLKSELDLVNKQDRSETGQLSEGAKDAIEQMELRIRLAEDRMVRLREQKIILQNDLTAEQRRLSHIEAILDTWLEKLE